MAEKLKRLVWRQRLRRLGSFVLVVLLVLVVLAVVLRDRMFHSMRSGEVGVQWSRFFGGTITDKVYGEGMHVILPWNTMTKYNVRYQTVDDTFDVLTRDGLRLEFQLMVRFKPNREDMPLIHKHIGPDYIDVLLRPEKAAIAREVVATVTPAELYSEKRLDVQNEIGKKLRRRTSLAPEVLEPQEDATPVVVTQQQLVVEVERRRRNDEDTDDRKDPERKRRKKLAKAFLKDQHENLLGIDDVLIRGIALPDGLAESIEDKLIQQQRDLEYRYRLQKEAKEEQRKVIASEGLAEFRRIAGISILQWRGIDATLELARSSNAELVFTGNRETGGLPLILGSLTGDETPPP